MSSYMEVVRWPSCTTSVWCFWHHFCRLDVIFTSVSAKRFDVNVSERSRTELLLIKKCSYFSINLITQHIFKSKCNCFWKSMQEKESIMVLRCKLKIPSLVTIRHHSASLVMPNSYPHNGIINQHLTTIAEIFFLPQDNCNLEWTYNRNCLRSRDSWWL